MITNKVYIDVVIIKLRTSNSVIINVLSLLYKRSLAPYYLEFLGPLLYTFVTAILLG